MPGRKFNPNSHRFGFNGQEEDKEWLGGQVVSFKFRIHDPRIVRFLSIDPLASKYPFYSPYQFASNSPVMAKELEGLESSNIVNNTEQIDNEIPDNLSKEQSNRFGTIRRNIEQQIRDFRAVGANDRATDAFRNGLLQMATIAEDEFQLNQSAANLRRYLNGGGDLELEWDFVAKYATTSIMIRDHISKFETWGSPSGNLVLIAESLKDGESARLNDFYSRVVCNNQCYETTYGIPSLDSDNPTSIQEPFKTDMAFALGNFTLTSTSHLTVTRSGNRFVVSGFIEHVATDIYNWDRGAVSIFRTRIEDSWLRDLDRSGAAPYNVRSAGRTNVRNGSFFTIDKNGQADFSNTTFIIGN